MMPWLPSCRLSRTLFLIRPHPSPVERIPDVNVFSWITAGVKHAVLKGFQEAAEELGLVFTPGDEAAPLNALESRMTATLPAPQTNEESRQARKGRQSA
jgi:hypothetical protein